MNHPTPAELRAERCSGCGEVDGCVCEHEISDDYASDCCGAAPKGNGDNDSMDIGICPSCGEHCEYVREGE